MMKKRICKIDKNNWKFDCFSPNCSVLLSIICDGTATITGGSVENGGCLTIEAASTNIKQSFAAAKGAELRILTRTKTDMR